MEIARHIHAESGGMTLDLFALLIGIVAGLRVLLIVMAVS